MARHFSEFQNAAKRDFLRSYNPFTTGNPFLGTTLLRFSIGRGLGALKGTLIIEYKHKEGESGVLCEMTCFMILADDIMALGMWTYGQV